MPIDPLYARCTKRAAEVLGGYAELGVKHIMIEFAPYTTEALDRVAGAMRVFRA